MAKKPESVPFQPSWLNRFFDAVDKLAVPKLVVFILITIGFALLNHIVPWLEKKLPWGTLDTEQFQFHIWFLVGFITFDYFVAYSKTALANFRPALKVTEKEYARLSYQFTTLSARAGWLITLFTALLTFALLFTGEFIPTYARSGWSGVTVFFSATLQFSLFLGLTVYLFSAMRMIRQLYDQVETVNLFHLEPIYAFSGFTVRVGLFFVLASTLGYLTGNAGWFLVFTVSLWTSLAIASFIWPLGGMHARLVAEKERMSDENDRRLNKTYAELHQRIDKKNDVGMVDFRSRVSALLDLRQEIRKISTWPWDSTTLRTFITALFVPLTVWLIQQFLLNTVAK